MDAQNVAQRIRFDAEDRLPPAYWDRLRQQPQEENNKTNKNEVKFKKIDPSEWAKAPEFIPKQQPLANSYGYSNPLSSIPFNNNGIMYSSVTNPSEAFGPNLMEISYDGSSSYHPSGPTTMSESFVSLPPPASNNGVSFNYQPILNQSRPPSFPPFQPCVPIHPSGPFGFVPKGYSANIAAINSGIGPPIAAIVLKKKRKRRSRRVMGIASGDVGIKDGQHPSDPNNGYESLSDVKRLQWQPPKDLSNNQKLIRRHMRSMSSEPDLTSMTNSDSGGRHSITGRLTSVDSCPDLSDEQLKLWDDILYNAVVKDSVAQQDSTKKMRKELDAAKIGSRSETPEAPETDHKEKSGSPVMRTSIYELCPSSIYDEDNNAAFVDDNEREKFLEEMSNSRSAVFDPTFAIELQKPIERPKTIEDSFNLIQQSGSELEDLKFKSPQKEYYRSPATQYMTYFNPKTNGLKNEVYNPDYDLDPQIEEDYFEGMRIRVNAFEDCEELTLSDSECPQPSRFQQLQWALQRQRERYVQVAPPDRACCSLM